MLFDQNQRLREEMAEYMIGMHMITVQQKIQLNEEMTKHNKQLYIVFSLWLQHDQRLREEITEAMIGMYIITVQQNLPLKEEMTIELRLLGLYDYQLAIIY